MLTLEKFLELEDGLEFARGTVSDNSSGINMTNSDKLLKWIAIKGYAEDWCIYAHFADNDFEFIKRSGDKVGSEEHIQRVIPCTDDVIARYRY